MKFRQCMTSDFSFLDAQWPLAWARATLHASASPHVLVVRHRHELRQHFVCSREDVARRLELSEEGELGTLLELQDEAASLCVDSHAEFVPSGRARVVLSRGRAVGLVLARGASRSAHGAVPKLAPPPQQPGLERQLSATLPGQAKLGELVCLSISLSAAAAGAPAPGAFRAPAGTRIDVLVRPLPGLELQGAEQQTLEVQEPQLAAPLTFQLRANAAGSSGVDIHACAQGIALAHLQLKLSIVAAGPAAVLQRERQARAQLEVSARTAPDLSLHIFERGRELSFYLHSADGRYHMSPVGGVSLLADPEAHFRDFFANVERLPFDTRAQRQQAVRELELKGMKLFESVLSPQLKGILWELRERIQTVQITSQEPWIPWEMCRLTGKDGGRVTEGGFFAETFSVTRWLQGAGAPSRLRLANLALVVPNGSQLAHAAAESALIQSLGGGRRRITLLDATHPAVTAAMASGVYDAWHFTGHGQAHEHDADQSLLALEEQRSLKPEHIVGAVENLLLPRPFVFLNACQTGRSGFSLTGVGGWVRRLLQSETLSETASAFIGSYWSVLDETALAFARGVYQGLFEGKPIGRAVQEARWAIRSDTDPTWLAYTVYADPNATLEPEQR